VAADIKIRYSVSWSPCLGLRRETTVKNFLWRRGYFPCSFTCFPGKDQWLSLCRWNYHIK